MRPRRPPGHTGLYHVAFVYPDRRELGKAVQRLLDHGDPADHATDHGGTVSVYLDDPDGNGVELYYDRPRRSWFDDRRAGPILKADRFAPAGPPPPEPPLPLPKESPMYAQVIEGGTTPERRDAMDRIVTDEMIPALEAEPGFAGAMNVVDRTSGNAMMIVLWNTEAQARRGLSEYGGAFLKALADVAAISTGTRRPISVWEVNARV